MTITYGLQIDKKKGQVRIRLPNAIKKENILQMENRIENSLTGCKGKVILDFADTLSVFSILITLIIHTRKRVDEFGGELCLVNVSDKCRSQLKATNLDKILTIYSNEVDFLKNVT